MAKVHVKERAGHAVAVFVDDGQGKRVVIAKLDGVLLREPVLVALTENDLDEAIEALRQFKGRLPGKGRLL